MIITTKEVFDAMEWKFLKGERFEYDKEGHSIISFEDIERYRKEHE